MELYEVSTSLPDSDRYLAAINTLTRLISPYGSIDMYLQHQAVNKFYLPVAEAIPSHGEGRDTLAITAFKSGMVLGEGIVSAAHGPTLTTHGNRITNDVPRHLLDQLEGTRYHHGRSRGDFLLSYAEEGLQAVGAQNRARIEHFSDHQRIARLQGMMSLGCGAIINAGRQVHQETLHTLVNTFRKELGEEDIVERIKKGKAR